MTTTQAERIATHQTQVQGVHRYDRIPMRVIVAAYMATGKLPGPMSPSFYEGEDLEAVDPYTAICLSQGQAMRDICSASIWEGTMPDGTNARKFWEPRDVLGIWQDAYLAGWCCDGSLGSYDRAEETRADLIATQGSNCGVDDEFGEAWGAREFDLGFAEGRRHRRVFERLGYTIGKRGA